MTPTRGNVLVSGLAVCRLTNARQSAPWLPAQFADALRVAITPHDEPR